MSREPWKPSRSTGHDWGRATAPWPRTSEGSRSLHDKLTSNRQPFAEGSIVAAEAADAAKVGAVKLHPTQDRAGEIGVAEVEGPPIFAAMSPPRKSPTSRKVPMVSFWPTTRPAPACRCRVERGPRQPSP